MTNKVFRDIFLTGAAMDLMTGGNNFFPSSLNSHKSKEPEVKYNNYKFIIKTKQGYFTETASFDKNKIKAKVFINYEDAKKIVDKFGGKIMKV